MYIDTHCHLNFHAFKDDVDEVVKRAKKTGVGKFIVPGAKLSSSEEAVGLAQRYPEVSSAVGIHPHHAMEVNSQGLFFQNEMFRRLAELAKNKKVVAIGEIGLDYHKYKGCGSVSPKEKQKELFLEQFCLAQSLGLPVILHCREAFEDLLAILPKKVNGVMHCFTGGLLHLKAALNLGLYIGFDGNITYDTLLGEAILNTPLDRLLLETDSPLLTPKPHRGERNEPKNIVYIASFVARIKKIERATLVEKTTENAERLFCL